MFFIFQIFCKEQISYVSNCWEIQITLVFRTLLDKMKNRSKITNWFEASPKKRESTSGTNAEPAVKREKLEQ